MTHLCADQAMELKEGLDDIPAEDDKPAEEDIPAQDDIPAESDIQAGDDASRSEVGGSSVDPDQGAAASLTANHLPRRDAHTQGVSQEDSCVDGNVFQCTAVDSEGIEETEIASSCGRGSNSRRGESPTNTDCKERKIPYKCDRTGDKCHSVHCICNSTHNLHCESYSTDNYGGDSILNSHGRVNRSHNLGFKENKTRETDRTADNNQNKRDCTVENSPSDTDYRQSSHDGTELGEKNSTRDVTRRTRWETMQHLHCEAGNNLLQDHRQTKTTPQYARCSSERFQDAPSRTANSPLCANPTPETSPEQLEDRNEEHDLCSTSDNSSKVASFPDSTEEENPHESANPDREEHPPRTILSEAAAILNEKPKPACKKRLLATYSEAAPSLNESTSPGRGEFLPRKTPLQTTPICPGEDTNRCDSYIDSSHTNFSTGKLYFVLQPRVQNRVLSPDAERRLQIFAVERVADRKRQATHNQDNTPGEAGRAEYLIREKHSDSTTILNETIYPARGRFVSRNTHPRTTPTGAEDPIPFGQRHDNNSSKGEPTEGISQKIPDETYQASHGSLTERYCLGVDTLNGNVHPDQTRVSRSVQLDNGQAQSWQENVGGKLGACDLSVTKRYHSDQEHVTKLYRSVQRDVTKQYHSDQEDVMTRCHSDQEDVTKRCHSDQKDVIKRHHPGQEDVIKRHYSGQEDVIKRHHSDQEDITKHHHSDQEDITKRYHSDHRNVLDHYQPSAEHSVMNYCHEVVREQCRSGQASVTATHQWTKRHCTENIQAGFQKVAENVEQDSPTGDHLSNQRHSHEQLQANIQRVTENFKQGFATIKHQSKQSTEDVQTGYDKVTKDFQQGFAPIKHQSKQSTEDVQTGYEKVTKDFQQGFATIKHQSKQSTEDVQTGYDKVTEDSQQDVPTADNPENSATVSSEEQTAGPPPSASLNVDLGGQQHSCKTRVKTSHWLTVRDTDTQTASDNHTDYDRYHGPGVGHGQPTSAWSWVGDSRPTCSERFAITGAADSAFHSRLTEDVQKSQTEPDDDSSVSNLLTDWRLETCGSRSTVQELTKQGSLCREETCSEGTSLSGMLPQQLQSDLSADSHVARSPIRSTRSIARPNEEVKPADDHFEIRSRDIKDAHGVSAEMGTRPVHSRKSVARGLNFTCDVSTPTYYLQHDALNATRSGMKTMKSTGLMTEVTLTHSRRLEGPDDSKTAASKSPVFEADSTNSTLWEDKNCSEDELGEGTNVPDLRLTAWTDAECEQSKPHCSQSPSQGSDTSPALTTCPPGNPKEAVSPGFNLLQHPALKPTQAAEEASKSSRPPYPALKPTQADEEASKSRPPYPPLKPPQADEEASASTSPDKESREQEPRPQPDVFLSIQDTFLQDNELHRNTPTHTASKMPDPYVSLTAGSTVQNKESEEHESLHKDDEGNHGEFEDKHEHRNTNMAAFVAGMLFQQAIIYTSLAFCSAVRLPTMEGSQVSVASDFKQSSESTSLTTGTGQDSVRGEEQCLKTRAIVCESSKRDPTHLEESGQRKTENPGHGDKTDFSLATQAEPGSCKHLPTTADHCRKTPLPHHAVMEGGESPKPLLPTSQQNQQGRPGQRSSVSTTQHRHHSNEGSSDLPQADHRDTSPPSSPRNVERSGQRKCTHRMVPLREFAHRFSTGRDISLQHTPWWQLYLKKYFSKHGEDGDDCFFLSCYFICKDCHFVQRRSDFLEWSGTWGKALFLLLRLLIRDAQTVVYSFLALLKCVSLVFSFRLLHRLSLWMMDTASSACARVVSTVKFFVSCVKRSLVVARIVSKIYDIVRHVMAPLLFVARLFMAAINALFRALNYMKKAVDIVASAHNICKSVVQFLEQAPLVWFCFWWLWLLLKSYCYCWRLPLAVMTAVFQVVFKCVTLAVHLAGLLWQCLCVAMNRETDPKSPASPLPLRPSPSPTSRHLPPNPE